MSDKKLNLLAMAIATNASDIATSSGIPVEAVSRLMLSGGVYAAVIERGYLKTLPDYTLDEKQMEKVAEALAEEFKKVASYRPELLAPSFDAGNN